MIIDLDAIFKTVGVMNIFLMTFCFLSVVYLFLFFLFFVFLADTTSINTTSLQNSKPVSLAETTPISTKNTNFDKPFVTPYLPYTVIYAVIVFVGILVILCGMFVGIYFYKHCMKQIIIENKRDADKTSDEYSSLGVDSHHQTQHSRDLIYLEPVSGNNGYYDEIKEKDEINEIFVETSSPRNENEIALQCNPSIPHSESLP